MAACLLLGDGRYTGLSVRTKPKPSVTMPFQAPSAAYWLMLGPEPELRRTDYDVERTAAEIRASDYWDAENAASQLLDPPDPNEMEALYERARVQRSGN